MTPERRAGRRPDSWDAFRWAHLLIVTARARAADRRYPLTVNRLATYDFFAGHPYLLFAEPDSEEQHQLVMAGFERGSLIYASAPQRLANRRQQLQSDVTALLARKLAAAETDNAISPSTLRTKVGKSSSTCSRSTRRRSSSAPTW